MNGSLTVKGRGKAMGYKECLDLVLIRCSTRTAFRLVSSTYATMSHLVIVVFMFFIFLCTVLAAPVGNETDFKPILEKRVTHSGRVSDAQ